MDLPHLQWGPRHEMEELKAALWSERGVFLKLLLKPKPGIMAFEVGSWKVLGSWGGASRTESVL